jgi:hypothetical protein
MDKFTILATNTASLLYSLIYNKHMVLTKCGQRNKNFEKSTEISEYLKWYSTCLASASSIPVPPNKRISNMPETN